MPSKTEFLPSNIQNEWMHATRNKHKQGTTHKTPKSPKKPNMQASLLTNADSDSWERMEQLKTMLILNPRLWMCYSLEVLPWLLLDQVGWKQENGGNGWWWRWVWEGGEESVFQICCLSESEEWNLISHLFIDKFSKIFSFGPSSLYFVQKGPPAAQT